MKLQGYTHCFLNTKAALRLLSVTSNMEFSCLFCILLYLPLRSSSIAMHGTKLFAELKVK